LRVRVQDSRVRVQGQGLSSGKGSGIKVQDLKFGV
jgi:hypothetical protein